MTPILYIKNLAVKTVFCIKSVDLTTWSISTKMLRDIYTGCSMRGSTLQTQTMYSIQKPSRKSEISTDYIIIC